VSRCVFSLEAHSDLRHIHDYIAQDSPRSAVRLADRLEETCLLLADQPRLGVARPEFGAEHRSFLAPGTRYVIIYRPMSDGVEIIHIRHGSQDLLRLFE
jgi:toxin ParE1/3/4